ncbi:hypothetical protein [Nocardia goodfellowii]|uniref:Uncharacterized protein n=1 Tax=Nocardia goodfellowii TaxID=882446 RepID=A0ABS4QNW2_9NOCA|nr:hypothetical protein [Nocardia goodfellowii]MBP2192815.1 hypothetical protein [Nocardia goodfellowii]
MSEVAGTVRAAGLRAPRRVTTNTGTRRAGAPILENFGQLLRVGNLLLARRAIEDG